MPLILPEMTAPLGRVSVCANRISLEDNPELASQVSDKKIIETAQVSNNRFLALTREKFPSGKYHFHLDLWSAQKNELPPGTPTTFDEINNKFSQLLGKLLTVNFVSVFSVPPKELGNASLIRLLANARIQFGGIVTALSAAQVRVEDSVFKEIGWNSQVDEDGKNPRFLVEVKGTLGEIEVSDKLLLVSRSRRLEALDKFITTKQPAK